eukprot:scaffold741_cov336-Pavlova_lutheri.AAC.69
MTPVDPFFAWMFSSDAFISMCLTPPILSPSAYKLEASSNPLTMHRTSSGVICGSRSASVLSFHSRAARIERTPRSFPGRPPIVPRPFESPTCGCDAFPRGAPPILGWPRSRRPGLRCTHSRRIRCPPAVRPRTLARTWRLFHRSRSCCERECDVHVRRDGCVRSKTDATLSGPTRTTRV